jgi:hypothetical protein
MAQPRASLVDLYVPAHLASPDALCARAAAVGLDALVLACEPADPTPDAAALAALSARHGVAVHIGRVLSPDESFRLVLLGAESVNPDLLTALEALGDPGQVRAAARELGRTSPTFACYRVGLRARPDLGVNPAPVPLSASDAGGVAVLLSGTSRLARDLDCEALGEAHVPILGASGPFAELDGLGRFATALPMRPSDATALARHLQAGTGFAVELLTPTAAAPNPPHPSDSASGPAAGLAAPTRRGGPSGLPSGAVVGLRTRHGDAGGAGAVRPDGASSADPSEGREDGATRRKRPRRRKRGGGRGPGPTAG